MKRNLARLILILSAIAWAIIAVSVLHEARLCILRHDHRGDGRGPGEQPDLPPWLDRAVQGRH